MVTRLRKRLSRRIHNLVVSIDEAGVELRATRGQVSLRVSWEQVAGLASLPIWCDSASQMGRSAIALLQPGSRGQKSTRVRALRRAGWEVAARVCAHPGGSYRCPECDRSMPWRKFWLRMSDDQRILKSLDGETPFYCGRCAARMEGIGVQGGRENVGTDTQAGTSSGVDDSSRRDNPDHELRSEDTARS